MSSNDDRRALTTEVKAQQYAMSGGEDCTHKHHSYLLVDNFPGDQGFRV